MQEIIRYRYELHKWLTGPEWTWHQKMAVTLTAQQVNDNGQWLSDEALIASVSHFLNRLNASFYKSNERRKGKRIASFPVGETGANGQRHFHLVVDCPIPIEISEFRRRVVEAWRNVDWASEQVDVQHADDGWFEYLTKPATKPDYYEAFILPLCHKGS